MTHGYERPTAGLILAAAITLGTPPAQAAQTIVDGFNGSSINAGIWEVRLAQWGGPGRNGGVIPENVSIADGIVSIDGNGDLYTGPKRGWNANGYREDHGRRSGGAIRTREPQGPGRFEVRMKPVFEDGVTTAMWTFFYNFNGGDVINHEIDIELLNRQSPSPTGFRSDYTTMNTWLGESSSQANLQRVSIIDEQGDPAPQDLDEFHTYRFDWFAGEGVTYPRVEFYVDGVHHYTSREFVPTIPGQFTVGLWFPFNWAGQPDFVTRTLEIDRVAITPLANIIPGDANADGNVNLTDLSLLATNFGSTEAAWSLGDFSGDGNVDLVDLSFFASNFGHSASTPEPVTFSLALLGLLASTRQRS
ncbi:family 16 glycosylhydrolase [Mucisphaera calidilacus]|uniref:Beta-glucanase n=1 Tax=Mucisphaera calidilacus TaxID=2527982 RepID=A0A518BU16_9BACT|nr:family 16 glycosylhydrolase [Mucisphaera calidilacus]QDU70470.1 Beta-glucanase precursor [Mucisphaera calidilacus]